MYAFVDWAIINLIKNDRGAAASVPLFQKGFFN